METNHEHFSGGRRGQNGNAMIYVLIAIALFAALSFTLSRHGDSGEAGTLPDDRAEIYASDLISYSAQVKSVIDQMLFTGTKIDDLDFILSTDAAFNTGTQLQKTRRVYHPEGGGLNRATLSADITTSAIASPPADWYLGRFVNVEWTRGAGEEVILVAFQIRREVCEKINLKITGSAAIPVLGDSIRETLIDDTNYGGTNVAEFTTDPAGTPICGACHNRGTLCVQDQGLNAYGFYTVIADQ